MRILSISFLSLLLLCGLQSCDDKQIPSPNDGKDSGQNNNSACTAISFDEIEEGAYSGIDKAKTAVIRNQQDWEDLYNEIHSISYPSSKAPTIDFTKYMIIGVFSGNRSSGGHYIAVKDVCEKSNAIEVNYVETSPGEGCIVTTAITQPYHLIKVKNSHKQVAFNKSAQKIKCNQDNPCNTPLGFSEIQRDSEAGTGIEKAQNLVIKDQKSWEVLWDDMHSGQLSKPTIPKIDFNDKWVVAVFQGMQGTGSHSIKVTNICRDDDSVIIQVKKVYPGDNCIVTQALTYPYQLIEIDHQDLSLKFKESTEVIQCK